MAGGKMNLGRATLCLGLAAGLSVLAGGFSATFSANPPLAPESPQSGIIPDISVGPGDLPQRKIDRDRAQSGNPLWAIPLSTLTATRERPIFRPSRRPPAAAALGQPRMEPIPTAAPSARERPQLTLIGAVVGEADAVAIFLDNSNNEVFRLRTGQDYSGWVLNLVRGREATLQKDRETAVYVVPVPGSDGAPAHQ
jgi:general secretion pathway protein N